jgi:hypothetical protein
MDPELDRPLAGGAVRLGDRVLLCGHDGTLLLTEIPEPASSEAEKVEN